jgi:hypothetical protein
MSCQAQPPCRCHPREPHPPGRPSGAHLITTEIVLLETILDLVGVTVGFGSEPDGFVGGVDNVTEPVQGLTHPGNADRRSPSVGRTPAGSGRPR